MLIILLSFTNFFIRYNQILLIISSIIGGLGIIVIIALSKPTELGYKYYYCGLILVLFWIYTFIRLRFWNSVIAALIITIGYEILALNVQNLLSDEEHFLVFLNNNFFFIGANILGSFASYHSEKLHRSDFLQKQKIKEENIRVLNYSTMLQQKNQQITAQNEEIEIQRQTLVEQNSLLEQQTEAIQHQNHELQEINTTKDKFFSIISHDLRNPFTSILSSSELLLTFIKNNNAEKSLKHASAIHDSVLLVNRLLANLIKWSQLQSGTLKPVIEYLNLKTIANEVYLLSREVAKSKNITLENLIHSDFYIRCDQEMTKTVLRNLISNAIKFTNLGGYISINAVENVEKIEISVSDNGVGIPPETMHYLFAIEKNISTKGTANERGTGLGLLLCKELIEKQGGAIWVESVVGKGSDFKFTLPL